MASRGPVLQPEPSVAPEARALAHIGLEDIGLKHVETLRRWQENLVKQSDELSALRLEEGFTRFWDLYLADCEATFLECHVSVVQLVLGKPAWHPNSLPAVL